MNKKTMQSGIRPTECEKRKAAMALNLCATSISRIIASNDMEVLDVEYNAILNNLNLQNMIKDEVLLSTFKSILDTITFYRLQAGDRGRAEARYQHKINSAIWSVGQQGACILFAPSLPWAALSGAIMAVGAFCNMKKVKSDASMTYDDEVWQLERSLIEQLHALRYSLFETSWRLSDRYGFDDAWRLTIPQIEQYNKILEEPDAAWRYFCLVQYKENFEAYPYYWNELGESACIASQKEGIDDTTRNDFLKKAEAAFEVFEAKDIGLLREDMISAAARLRRIQIAVKRGKTWDEVLGGRLEFFHKLKGLACSAPELLMQGAVCYMAAHEAEKFKGYLDAAIELMEMVVAQGYNMPTSSRLLSKMYLDCGDIRKQEYRNLLDRFGAVGVISDIENTDSILIETDSRIVTARLRQVLSRQFELAKRISNNGLFAGDSSAVDGKVEKYIVTKKLNRDYKVKDELILLWDDLKQKLNTQMWLLVEKIGVDRKAMKEIACRIDGDVTRKINEYAGSWCSKADSKDCAIEQQRALYRIIDLVAKDFVEELAKAVDKVFDLKRMDHIMAVNDGLSTIERELAEIMRKLGVSIEDDGCSEADDFFTSDTLVNNGDELSWVEYQSDPSIGKRLMEGKKSFYVRFKNIKDVWIASRQIEKELERLDYKVRDYTQGLQLIALNPWGAGCLLSHRIATINPDYEVIRYPLSIEVRYMRDATNDIKEKASTTEKMTENVRHKVKSVKRMVNDGRKVVTSTMKKGRKLWKRK